jgi:hypothetical protein
MEEFNIPQIDLVIVDLFWKNSCFGQVKVILLKKK